MKKQLCMMITLVILIICAGCSMTKKSKFDLPGNPAQFDMKTYNASSGSGDDYEAFEYDGSIYIPYGSANNEEMDERIVEKCLGYISGGGSEDKNLRVFTLKEDGKNNYLMIYDIEKDLSQALFYRKTDTRDQKIETPGYIDAVHYDYWE